MTGAVRRAASATAVQSAPRPFERVQHNSNTYNDWAIQRLFVVVPLQAIATRFLKTMADYTPNQTADSFNREKFQKTIERVAVGGN